MRYPGAGIVIMCGLRTTTELARQIADPGPLDHIHITYSIDRHHIAYIVYTLSDIEVHDVETEIDLTAMQPWRWVPPRSPEFMTRVSEGYTIAILTHLT